MIPAANMGYWERMERISEYYDYYAENFLANSDLRWSGLARLAGNQVCGGLSDSQNVKIGAWVWAALPGAATVIIETKKLQQALFEGGYKIYQSLGWQHHAYRRSGIVGLEWTNDEFLDEDLFELFDSWDKLDGAKRLPLVFQAEALSIASQEMTSHEQWTIIQPTWDTLKTIGIPDLTAKIFSDLALNPCWPIGKDFIHTHSGQGDLSNPLQRWTWIAIDNDGILANWNILPEIEKQALVSLLTLLDADHRFTLAPFGIGTHVRDHLDNP